MNFMEQAVNFAEESIYRTADAMVKVGHDGLEELEKRLANGTAGFVVEELGMLGALGEKAAAELIEAARPDFEQIVNITRLRKELHQRIDDAQKEIQEAQRVIRDLWRDWGDVEYMEGDDDTEHCLNEARRQLRLAQAIKPTDENGN